jgi:hypothetical protein
MVRLDSPLFPGEVPTETNSHPIELTTQDLAEILRSIKIRKEIGFFSYYVLRKDSKPERVFTDNNLVLLASRLSAALAKAQPNETVVFLVSHAREDSIPVITSGGLFVRGEQLYVFIGNVGTPTPSERTKARVKENPIKHLGTPDFRFVAGPHQTILRAKQTNAHPGNNSSPGLLISYKALLTDTYQSEKAVNISPGSQFVPQGSSVVEEKLRQLKAWHEQGLITEEEYKKKRAELLNSF